MPAFQLLENSPALFALSAVVLGLIVGSFLNVVIARLPAMMERDWRIECARMLHKAELAPPAGEAFNLIVPRSRCPHCGHPVSALQNIPVISYLVLGGRCAACSHAISARYPAVEAVSGLLAGIVAWHYGFGLQALGALVLTWALIALSVIDFEHQYLPDSITLPFLWLGLGLSLFGLYVPTQASVIGAMLGYGVLWAVYQLFRIVTGKEGMGYGDFKLLAMLGAWLGWQSLPAIILLSSLVGAVVGIALIVFRGQDRNVPIPFGPYIAAAGWIVLLWGGDLTRLYLQLGSG